MDQNAPRLAGLLRSLRPEVRHTILAKACAFSAVSLGNVDAEVSELLIAIQMHGTLSREQAAKAVTFAEAADKRSFELEEQCAPRNEWLKPLSEARLSMAIAMAFGPDSENDGAAFYELLKSSDHGSGLERFIESEIITANSMK
jgi:hypothetical protein